MSSDDLSATPRTPPDALGGGTDTQQLLGRLRDARRDTTPETIMTAIANDLLDGGVDEVTVPRAVVTPTLDELLLALVTLREDDTHGTGLMEDIGTLFDVDPSPGTVYPRLHDLEAEGLLARHDLVKTKRYALEDEEAAADRIQRAASQHLAVGLFLHAALEDR
jgi:hypothetical protein